MSRSSSAVTRWKQTHAASAPIRLKAPERLRIALVCSAFNEPLSLQLLTGAEAVLNQHGIIGKNITTLWVPGTFELPACVGRLLQTRRPAAVIALGTLIRGQTIQYEIIGHAVANALTTVSAKSGVPISFGIVVASTLAQARARCGGRAGNRGEEAALAALRMIETFENAGIEHA